MMNSSRHNKMKGSSKRLRVPFIEQMEQSECGICCLAMILAYYKSHTPLSELRERGGGGRDGTKLLTLRNIAQSLGMEGKGQRIPIDGLFEIQLPSILHWEKSHFVVLEKNKSNKVFILDPAIGRRVIDLNELKAKYSGTALILTPTNNLVKNKPKPVWRQIFKLMFSEPWLISTILVWSLWLQLLAILTPMITQYIVDQVLIPQNVDLMKIIGVAMISLLIFQSTFTYLRAKYLVKLQNALDWQLMSRFFRHLLRLPYKFFQLRTSGDLILRANSNMIIREILSTRMVTAVLDGGFILVFLIYMLGKSPVMTGWVVLIGMIQVVVLIFSNSLIKRYSQEELLQQTLASSYLTEVLHGISVIKSEGVEKMTYSRWANLFQNQLSAARRRGLLSVNTETLVNILKFAAPLLLLWIGAQEVIAKQMTLGSLFAFYSLALSFLTPLTSLITTLNQMVIIGVYLNRIVDIIEAEPEQDEKKVIQPERLKGEIELQNVSFRYHPFSPKVIDNVSLKIKPGQKVALVGTSGSGKSTLSNLLLGLYEPTEGQILYDGQDLSKLNKSALRQQIGVVTQNTFLFNRSVYENIAMHDPQMPKEKVIQAAKIAAIHDSIIEMPLKYGTIISETGSNISGGQRQRIVLARALAHFPVILLLDEATSALDTITEKKIDHNLSNLNCTRVVIAHRLSTIRNADVIIVVDNGQVIEWGTHEELMYLNKHYARFYESKQEEEEKKVEVFK